MSESGSTANRWLRLSVVLTPLLAVSIGPVFGTGLVDDSYIFARYADHLVAGEGAVFNPGERVEGYTSPAHLVLTAAGVLSGLEPIDATLAISLLALCMLPLVLGFGLPGRMGPLSAWLTAAFVPLGVWGWTGMDAPLFALAIAVVVVVFQRARRRIWVAGAVAGCTVLVRPEGLVVILAAFCALLPQLRNADARTRFGVVVSLLLPTLFMTGFRLAYYDAPLPNTFYAKVSGGGFDLWLRGARYLINGLVAAAPLVVLAAVGLARRLKGAEWPTPAMWIAAGLMGGIVVTGGDHFPLYRFVLPVVPVLAVVASQALSVDGPLRSLVLGGATACVLLVTSWTAPSPLSEHDKSESTRMVDEVELATLWSHVGTSLRERLGEERTVALIAVGAIPYQTGWRTIDMLGLTDRHIAQATSAGAGYVGHEKFDSSYVLEKKPEFIVLLPMVWPQPVPESVLLELVWGDANKDLMKHPKFGREYELIWIESGRGVIGLHRRLAP
ncbi:MAG: arabinofuranosyltransferase [Myxococcota bacterium]|jgi:arabinofuranosyltransferase